MGIKYTGLIPVLIEAINELDSMLNLQDSKISDLENTLSSLESTSNIIGSKKSTSVDPAEDVNHADRPFLTRTPPSSLDSSCAKFLSSKSL